MTLNAWIKGLTIQAASAQAPDGRVLPGLTLRFQVVRSDSGPGWENRPEDSEWMFCPLEQFGAILSLLQNGFEELKQHQDQGGYRSP